MYTQPGLVSVEPCIHFHCREKESSSSGSGSTGTTGTTGITGSTGTTAGYNHKKPDQSASPSPSPSPSRSFIRPNDWWPVAVICGWACGLGDSVAAQVAATPGLGMPQNANPTKQRWRHHHRSLHSLPLPPQPVMNIDAKLLSSHRTQLALTALVSGVVVGSTILAFQKVNRLSKLKNLKDSIPKSSESVALTDYGAAASADADKDRALAASALRGDWDEDLIAEQLSRNATFLGAPGLAAVRSSTVIVVGCGGVGSWAATMLVRSGVGRIRLIDFDQVSLSSLNRHAVATLADVGTPKVTALKTHLAAVAPWVEIDARNELWTLADAETLLAGSPTWVVDAIDNIATKVDLLAYCHARGLKVISAMGAGCKSDPSRIQIGDISESSEDPLSRSTRRRLRQKGIVTGIPTVYSTEKAGPGKAALLPLSAEEFARGGVDELAPLPEFRVRILPVLGTMPGVFGLCVANHVIASIAGYPLEYSVGKDRGKLYEEMIAQLAGQESRLRGNVPGLRVPLREEDAGYVVEEVYKGRSVVSGYYTRLVLARWEALPEREDGGVWGMEEHRIGIDGVVVMTKDEAKKHEKEVLKGRKSAADVWGPEVVARVEARRKEEAEYAKYR